MNYMQKHIKRIFIAIAIFSILHAIGLNLFDFISEFFKNLNKSPLLLILILYSFIKKETHQLKKMIRENNV